MNKLIQQSDLTSPSVFISRRDENLILKSLDKNLKFIKQDLIFDQDKLSSIDWDLFYDNAYCRSCTGFVNNSEDAIYFSTSPNISLGDGGIFLSLGLDPYVIHDNTYVNIRYSDSIDYSLISVNNSNAISNFKISNKLLE